MIDKIHRILDPSDIEKIELKVAEKSRGLAFGEHKSVFSDTSGVEFSSIRDWELGDAHTRIAWMPSSRSNFRNIFVRESVEERAMDVLLVLDASPSIFFGIKGSLIAEMVIRAAATIGFSASIIQDNLGALIFGNEEVQIQPKPGREHVFATIETYEELLKRNAAIEKYHAPNYAMIAERISNMLIRPSLVIVISDFLYQESNQLIKKLAALNGGNLHDIGIVIPESSFAFNLPNSSSGWIECADPETGMKRHFSRKQLVELAMKIKEWQVNTKTLAIKTGLRAMIAPQDKDRLVDELIEFFLDRDSI